MTPFGAIQFPRSMIRTTASYWACLRTISRVLLVALCCAGCAAPSIRGVEEVSIRLYDDADYQMIIGPASRPKSGLNAGTGAINLAAVGFKDCAAAFPDPFTKLFAGVLCGAGGLVIGAGVGAAVSAAEGGNATPANNTPSGPSIEVKQAWHSKLQEQLEGVGRQRGKAIVAYPDGVTVHVVVDEFRWDIKRDERAAILGTLLVGVGENGDYALKQVSLTSPYRELDEWLDSGGQLITTEIDGFGGKIAAKVWDIVD